LGKVDEGVKANHGEDQMGVQADCTPVFAVSPRSKKKTRVISGKKGGKKIARLGCTGSRQSSERERLLAASQGFVVGKSLKKGEKD